MCIRDRGYGDPPAIGINPDLFHSLTSAVFPGAADDPGDRTHRKAISSSKGRSKRNVAALCHEPEPADPQHPDEKRTGKYKGCLLYTSPSYVFISSTY